MITSAPEIDRIQQETQPPARGAKDTQESIIPGDFSDSEDDEDDEDEFADDDDLLIDLITSNDNENDNEELQAEPSEPAFEGFTLKEAKAIRARLREIGLNEFVKETITAGKITAKKMLTAFGMRPPACFEDRPDEGYYRLLGLLMVREISTRKKLPQYNTLDDAVALLKKSTNILVITGAGISTNLGVPDFRSTSTGFYAKMRAEHGFTRPEEIFDIEVFDEDPSIFFKYSSETLPAPGKSTPTHAFIKLLDDRNQLLTNYTQNIDNIEGNVGISTSKLIQCHGSWATFTCRKCGHQAPGQQYYELVKRQEIPRCAVCPLHLNVGARPPLKRKRSSKVNASRRNSWDDDDDDDADDDIPEAGIMKPDITFFGEKLPDNFFDRFKKHDRERVDLVIVIGTSMMVAPVSEIPMALAEDVPHIYISRAPVEHMEFDITLLGDCDLVVTELARRAEWDLVHPMLQKIEVDVQCEDADLAIWKLQNAKDAVESHEEAGIKPDSAIHNAEGTKQATHDADQLMAGSSFAARQAERSEDEMKPKVDA